MYRSSPKRSTIGMILGRSALALAGWRIVGVAPPLPRFVAIVAPHSSNWDFFVGLAARFALGLDVHWLGKHTLFRWPLGPILLRLGGRPVRRDAPEGAVAAAAAMMCAEPRFVLALAPEGTRRRVAQWRTGFYRIAESAGVPIVPVAMDWSRREITLGEPLTPTGDLAADLAALQARYRPEMARYPECFWGTPA